MIEGLIDPPAVLIQEDAACNVGHSCSLADLGAAFIVTFTCGNCWLFDILDKLIVDSLVGVLVHESEPCSRVGLLTGSRTGEASHCKDDHLAGLGLSCKLGKVETNFSIIVDLEGGLPTIVAIVYNALLVTLVLWANHRLYMAFAVY